VPPDGPVASDLEVGPAELVLDLLVALLDPVAQPIGTDDLGKLGLLGAAAGGASQVAQQIPGGQLGRCSGSVVATTSRWCRFGPQPPSTASAASVTALSVTVQKTPCWCSSRA
jgi:hypothetical protein